MITKNISLNLQACLSGEPFSFDELIIETRELWVSKLDGVCAAS